MHRRFGLIVTASLALTTLFGALPHATAATPVEGAEVATWKTWNIASPDEITVPAPPAENSDQTKADLNELRVLQQFRSPLLNRVVQNWDGQGAVQRWSEIAIRLPLHPVFGGRISAYMHTAMLDAVVVAYKAKYTHNRKAPAELATDLTPSSETVAGEPSYPSEHAAIAGAASTVLAFFFPDQAKQYEALAQEAAFSRMIAGTNTRSDVEAGLAIGRAVAEKAIARAKTDGSDAVSAEALATGPGLWGGTTTVARLKGTWRPWLMTSGSQLRSPPPPAIDSPEFKAALAEVKHLAMSVTPSEKALSAYWTAIGPAPFIETVFPLMAEEKTSPARAARIMAHIATSYDDAGIASWETKFHYNYLRPIQADPTIPLMTPTPPYPDYTSGFSVWMGALSESIGYFFPQDAARLRMIAEQVAIMRIYQGVHFRFAVEAGLEQGRKVAQLGAERDKANDL